MKEDEGDGGGGKEVKEMKCSRSGEKGCAWKGASCCVRLCLAANHPEVLGDLQAICAEKLDGAREKGRNYAGNVVHFTVIKCPTKAASGKEGLFLLTVVHR